MADTLSVKITADTTDLSAKLALAKADLAAFNAQTTALARQARQAGDDIRGGLIAQLEQSAGRATAAKASVTALRAELGGLGSALLEAGTSAATAGINISSITRFTRELFDEVSTGRSRYLPSTLAALANQGLRLNGMMLLGAGGVAALVAGLGYLIYRAAEANEALTSLSGVAAFNNLDIGNAQIQKFVDEVHAMSGVTRDDAEQTVREFLNMRNATVPLIQAMIELVQQYAAATGDKVPEAAKKLSAAFAEPLAKGEEFLRSINANRAALQQFDAAAQRGDAAQALTVMMTTLGDAVTRLEEKTHMAAQSQTEMVTVTDSLRAALDVLTGTGVKAAVILGNLGAQIKQLDANKIKEIAKALTDASTAAKVQQIKQPTGAPLEDVSAQIEQKKLEMEQAGATNAQILAMEADTWKKRIAIGDLSGKELARADLDAGRAQLEAQKATGEQLVEGARNQIALIAANTLKGETARQSETVAVWQKLLGSQRLNAEQRQSVERDYNLAVASLRSEEAEDHLRKLQADVAATKAGTKERMAAIAAEVGFARSAYGQESTAYIEAQKAQQEEARVEKEQAAALQLKATEDYVKGLDKQLQASIKHFDQLYKAHQISIADQIRIEQNLTTAVLAEETKRLQATSRVDGISAQDAQRIADQITAIKERASDQQVAINDKSNDEIEAQDRKLQRDLRSIFEPFNSFFDSTLSAMLDRSQSFDQQMERAFAQLVSKLITEIAELAIRWAAFQASTRILGAGSAITGAIGNPFGAGASGLGGAIGGLFGGGAAGGGAGNANAATQQLVTAITGNTAATTQNSSGIIQWIGEQLESLAQWLGLTTATTAQTAATTTDVAAQGGLIGAIATLEAALYTNTAALYVSAGAKLIPFAGGGIVTRPTAALVGEAGPEAIIPLSAFAGGEGVASIGTNLNSRLGLPQVGNIGIPSLGPGIGAAGGGAGGGSINTSFQVTALDAKSIQSLVNSGTFQRQVSATVARQWRNAPSTRPGY